MFYFKQYMDTGLRLCEFCRKVITKTITYNVYTHSKKSLPLVGLEPVFIRTSGSHNGNNVQFKKKLMTTELNKTIRFVTDHLSPQKLSPSQNNILSYGKSILLAPISHTHNGVRADVKMAPLTSPEVLRSNLERSSEQWRRIRRAKTLQ